MYSTQQFTKNPRLTIIEWSLLRGYPAINKLYGMQGKRMSGLPPDMYKDKKQTLKWDNHYTKVWEQESQADPAWPGEGWVYRQDSRDMMRVGQWKGKWRGNQRNTVWAVRLIQLVNNFALVLEGVTRALKRIVLIIKIPLAFSTENLHLRSIQTGSNTYADDLCVAFS